MLGRPSARTKGNMPLLPVGASNENHRVRESRAVPRYSCGEENVWRAAIDGVITSRDLDNRFQFSPKSLPYQIQEQRKVVPLNPCVKCKLFRPPAVPLVGDPRVAVMAKEVRALERDNAVLNKTVKRQDALIAAFCELFNEKRANR